MKTRQGEKKKKKSIDKTYKTGTFLTMKVYSSYITMLSTNNSFVRLHLLKCLKIVTAVEHLILNWMIRLKVEFNDAETSFVSSYFKCEATQLCQHF